VWDDSGSGAFADGSIWRPVVPAGYVALGDVAVAGHDPPTGATLLVRDDPEVLRASPSLTSRSGTTP
jgi:vacuolar protein sorting-associated protein 13A/C